MRQNDDASHKVIWYYFMTEQFFQDWAYIEAYGYFINFFHNKNCFALKTISDEQKFVKLIPKIKIRIKNRRSS
jgi:hypothetical protein